MAVLVFAFVVLMPFISFYIIEPYIYTVYSTCFGQYGMQYAQMAQYVSVDNIYISVIILVVMLLVLLVGTGRKNRKKTADIYLAGASVDSDNREFLGSMNKEVKSTSRNMYLSKYFGEDKLSPIGSILCIVIYILAFGVSMYTFVQAVLQAAGMN